MQQYDSAERGKSQPFAAFRPKKFRTPRIACGFLSVFALGCGAVQLFARLVVAEGGDALPAQGAYAEVQRNAQPVHPYRLRQQQGGEHEPICRVRAAAQDQHEGDDEGVHEYGENAADDEFERRIFDEPPGDPRQRRRNERAQAAQPDVPYVARDDVCDQAAHIQRGDGFRVKEGKHGQRLRGADLKAQRAEGERAQRPGEYDVQRGDDARPAQHLGGGSFHYSVTSVVFR